MATPQTFTGSADMSTLYETEDMCAAMNLVLYVTANWSHKPGDACADLDEIHAVLGEMARAGWRCHALTVEEPARIAELARDIIHAAGPYPYHGVS